MNKTSIFDYSITFLEEYGIWCVLGLVFCFFAGLWIKTAMESRQAKEDKKKVVTKSMLIKTVAVMSIPFFCWLFVAELNPSYFGYGYSTNGIDVLAHDDSTLWLSDYYTKSAGGRGSYCTYRIQGINLNNGKRAFKKLSSNEYKIEGNGNHLVWVKIKEELRGMNAANGETVKTITKKTLGQTVPELSMGVFEYSYNAKTQLLDVTSNDGLKLTIDPASNTVVPAPVKQDARSFIDDKSIDDNAGNAMLMLIRDGEREHLIDNNRKPLSATLFFLKGKFIEADTISKMAFTFSYQTLDKKVFLIRCISMDGKLLWEAKQNDLKVGDFFEPQPKFIKAFLYRRDLIVVAEGFVISLNAQTGHCNWVSRI